jgi:hypothetical protein
LRPNLPGDPANHLRSSLLAKKSLARTFCLAFFRRKLFVMSDLWSARGTSPLPRLFAARLHPDRSGIAGLIDKEHRRKVRSPAKNATKIRFTMNQSYLANLLFITIAGCSYQGISTMDETVVSGFEHFVTRVGDKLMDGDRDTMS